MIKKIASTKVRNQSPYPSCYIARTGIRKKEMEASSDSKVEEDPDFLTPIIVFFRELSFPAKSGDRKVLTESRSFPISVLKQPVSEPLLSPVGRCLSPVYV